MTQSFLFTGSSLVSEINFWKGLSVERGTEDMMERVTLEQENACGLVKSSPFQQIQSYLYVVFARLYSLWTCLLSKLKNWHESGTAVKDETAD